MRRSIRDATVTLRGIMTVRRNGAEYTYYRRAGSPLVRLPDLPHDDPEFLAAYAAAARANPPGGTRHPPESLAALCLACEGSDAFNLASKGYRAILLRHFKVMVEKYGHVSFRAIRAKHIQKDVRDAASPADRRKAWRFVYSFDPDLLADNPTLTVTVPDRPKTEGHLPWTRDEIEAYRARWAIGTTKRLAFEVLHWGGMRISDAVLVGPGGVDRSGVLAFRQVKTGGMAYVPWTCPLPAYCADMAPDRDMLHAALSASSTRQMTFLATASGKTRSEKALGTMIREAAREAEVEKSAHGLRKSRAVSLADAGGTVHQIAAWTGHESLKEIERYTRAANRRRAVMGAEQEQNIANQPEQVVKSGGK